MAQAISVPDIPTRTPALETLSSQLLDLPGEREKALAPIRAQKEAARSQVSEELARPLPEPPAFRTMPEYRPREVSPQELMTFMTLATALASLGAAATRTGLTGALAAAGSAMQGFRAGRLEQARIDLENFRAQAEAALRANEQLSRQYQAVLQNRRLSLDQKLSQLQLIAQKEQDEIALWALRSGDLKTFFDLEDKRTERARRALVDQTKLTFEAMKLRIESQKAAMERFNWFGGGTHGRALSIITSLAPGYGAGVLSPDRERLFEAALTEYMQPRQIQNPETGMVETIRPELPGFVQEALRKRGRELPQREVLPTPGAAEKPAALGAGPSAAPRAGAVSTPQGQTIWQMRKYLAGPISTFFGTAPRHWPLSVLLSSEPEASVRDYVRLAEGELIRHLQNNPNYPEGERKWIEKNVKLVGDFLESFFESHESKQARLLALDRFLQERAAAALERSVHPGLGRNERQQARRVFDAVQEYRRKLGVPPTVYSEKDLASVPIGGEFYDPYTRSVRRRTH